MTITLALKSTIELRTALRHLCSRADSLRYDSIESNSNHRDIESIIMLEKIDAEVGRNMQHATCEGQNLRHRLDFELIAKIVFLRSNRKVSATVLRLPVPSQFSRGVSIERAH